MIGFETLAASALVTNEVLLKRVLEGLAAVAKFLRHELVVDDLAGLLQLKLLYGPIEFALIVIKVAETATCHAQSVNGALPTHSNNRLQVDVVTRACGLLSLFPEHLA